MEFVQELGRKVTEYFWRIVEIIKSEDESLHFIDLEKGDLIDLQIPDTKYPSYYPNRDSVRGLLSDNRYYT